MTEAAGVCAGGDMYVSWARDIIPRGCREERGRENKQDDGGRWKGWAGALNSVSKLCGKERVLGCGGQVGWRRAGPWLTVKALGAGELKGDCD